MLDFEEKIIFSAKYNHYYAFSFTFPVFRASLPLKLSHPKNQAVSIPGVANVSDPR